MFDKTYMNTAIQFDTEKMQRYTYEYFYCINVNNYYFSFNFNILPRS